ncbi:hypothetical protein F5148DRAFT_1188773, partial [Russula earlei]
MTNEELASLEPIIAQAWDQWDRQVRPPPRHTCKPPDGQPARGGGPSPAAPQVRKPRSSWVTHRRQHSPSPRRIITNIRRRKQTIFAHAFIARSSRRPFAPSASVPALPATLPPQLRPLQSQSCRPPPPR